MSNTRAYDLKDRLIDFAVRVIRLAEALPDSKSGRHVSQQVLRSGTSVAANYGEAQSAESKKDFVHKMKIALKELRETLIWLKIIARKRLGDEGQLPAALAECGELVAIFVRSTKTADGNAG